jgi:5-methylcytosine-specific restriction endonuclease McrA
VLLVDSLWDEYTRSWESKLSSALDRFLESFVSAKARKDSPTPDEFWIKYGQWTRVNSDRGDTIARRHLFYAEKMLEYLTPLQPKDPKRTFGELERAVLFFRHRKICAVCDAEVSWNEAEVHHVIEHSKGGTTKLDNAALVHKACHPKSDAATKALAEKLTSLSAKSKETKKKLPDENAIGYLWKSGKSRLFLPHGTELRMTYKKSDYKAKIDEDQLLYEGVPYTPSAFVHRITGTSRNAWRDIWIKFPGDDDWSLADELRSDAPLTEEV